MVLCRASPPTLQRRGYHRNTTLCPYSYFQVMRSAHRFGGAVPSKPPPPPCGCPAPRLKPHPSNTNPRLLVHYLEADIHICRSNEVSPAPRSCLAELALPSNAHFSLRDGSHWASLCVPRPNYGSIVTKSISRICVAEAFAIGRHVMAFRSIAALTHTPAHANAAQPLTGAEWTPDFHHAESGMFS